MRSSKGLPAALAWAVVLAAGCAPAAMPGQRAGVVSRPPLSSRSAERPGNLRHVLLALFAGIYVSDIQAATHWYARLLGGQPSFIPHDAEAVWELAEDRSIYINARPEDAGHSVVTVFVGDLDERVVAIAERGSGGRVRRLAGAGRAGTPGRRPAGRAVLDRVRHDRVLTAAY